MFPGSSAPEKHIAPTGLFLRFCFRFVAGLISFNGGIWNHPTVRIADGPKDDAGCCGLAKKPAS